MKIIIDKKTGFIITLTDDFKSTFPVLSLVANSKYKLVYETIKTDILNIDLNSFGKPQGKWHYLPIKTKKRIKTRRGDGK